MQLLIYLYLKKKYAQKIIVKMLQEKIHLNSTAKTNLFPCFEVKIVSDGFKIPINFGIFWYHSKIIHFGWCNKDNPYCVYIQVYVRLIHVHLIVNLEVSCLCFENQFPLIEMTATQEELIKFMSNWRYKKKLDQIFSLKTLHECFFHYCDDETYHQLAFQNLCFWKVKLPERSINRYNTTILTFFLPFFLVYGWSNSTLKISQQKQQHHE